MNNEARQGNIIYIECLVVGGFCKGMIYWEESYLFIGLGSWCHASSVWRWYMWGPHQLEAWHPLDASTPRTSFKPHYRYITHKHQLSSYSAFTHNLTLLVHHTLPWPACSHLPSWSSCSPQSPWLCCALSHGSCRGPIRFYLCGTPQWASRQHPGYRTVMWHSSCSTNGYTKESAAVTGICSASETIQPVSLICHGLTCSQPASYNLRAVMQSPPPMLCLTTACTHNQEAMRFQF